jgi:hypothetical protein
VTTDCEAKGRSDMARINELVALVVDPECGQRIREIAARMPAWVVDTPTNRRAVRALRDEAAAGSARLTTFRSAPDETPEEACIQILPTLDLHHGELSQDPPYSAVEVIGAKPTAAVRRAFEALQLRIVDMRDQGFVASRADAQAE